jgi:hypothetical protein
MTTKSHNGLCPQVQVLQEADEAGKDTTGVKNLPHGNPVDIVVSIGEVNEGHV